MTGFDRKLTCSLNDRTQTKAHFRFLEWWVNVKMSKSCQASNQMVRAIKWITSFLLVMNFMLIPFNFFYW